MMKILYHSQNDDYMALISLDKANAFDGRNKQLLVDGTEVKQHKPLLTVIKLIFLNSLLDFCC